MSTDQMAAVPHPEKTMASTHVDAPQGSSVDILVANKVQLIEWLSEDLYILQHAQADGIINHRVYKQLTKTPKLTTEDACTQLIDTITLNGGEGTSYQFLQLLRKPEILDAYPHLKQWNSSFAMPGPPEPRITDSLSVPDDSDDGETAAKRRKEDLTVKTPEDSKSIEFYQNQLQSNVEDPFTCLPEGSVQPTDRKDFEFHTDISILHLDGTVVSIEHEVRQMEREKAWQESETVMKKAGQAIQLSDIYTHPSGKNIRIRTVMTIGNAGIGKTFLVHKLVSDWAKEQHQHPHLIFVFQFRYLNLLRGQKFTLAQLIHECMYATTFIPEEALNDIFTKLQKSGNANYDKSLFKLLFVFDGLDESNLLLHFNTKPNHGCSDDFSKPILLEELLVNLIEGKLLRCARIWITTRPAAAKLIPFVDMWMEVKGFTDAKKVEYFRKRFTDELAGKIISHMKTSKTFNIMCEIPVFCSMAAIVLRDMLRRDETGQLPKTHTEMNCRFLIVQTKRNKRKYDESHDANQQQLTEADGEVLLKLGRLAFEHLEKGSIIFYQEHLEECGLDVNEASWSGVCTEIFKGESLSLQKNVYSFVHLTIQEFLAAVYLFHCFTEKNKKVLKTFLGEEDEWEKRERRRRMMGEEEEEADMTLDDFLYRVMKKSQSSKNGHLDLFVRFLHGLLLESNQSQLGGLLDQTENSPESIQRVINNLKEMTTEDEDEDEDPILPERMINIFHCLMEMNDHSVLQEIQQYLESGDRSKTKLSPSQCSALAFMLLMSEDVLDELYLDKYNSDMQGRRRLIPVVRNCRKARLVDCELEQTHVEVVASALSSNPSHLRELDLSENKLNDSVGYYCTTGLVELLCEGLKSLHCRLEILRLAHCNLSERCCELLVSAVSSHPSLRELDLSSNMMVNVPVLENCKVKHGGEDWLNPQLITRCFQRLTLDTNTASRELSLSEDNREVTRLEEGQVQYPDHPERFDVYPQVLCTEALTGRSYWEVEWSGWVQIAVTYRGISRKGQGDDCGLGDNSMSWILFCLQGFSYRVIHNREQTGLPVMTSIGSNRVAVYVDGLAGTLSFYTVSSDSLTHLKTFQTTFTEPLYAGFRLWYPSSSSVCLCEQR